MLDERSRRLMNKLIHAPTKALRGAAVQSAARSRQPTSACVIRRGAGKESTKFRAAIGATFALGSQTH